MNSFELFTGAGGLAMGIHCAGFINTAVIERDRYACDTIRHNQNRCHSYVRNWNLIECDVRDYDYRPFHGKVDLLAGGPPCQPFSLGGKHGAHLDARDMFPEAVRAVRELAPPAFVFENVKGLTRQSFSSYFNYIYYRLCLPECLKRPKESWNDHLRRLEKIYTSGSRHGLSYRVVWRVLNSADYGIPQRRHRVIFVGFRSDIQEQWSFPPPTHSEESLLSTKWITGEYWERHRVPKSKRPSPTSQEQQKAERIKVSLNPQSLRLPWRTVRDATSGLPSPSLCPSKRFLNHQLVSGARSYPGHTGSPLDSPAKTLKANVHGVPGGENMILFPDGSVRYFSIREAARIQTFPDDYLFHGSWTECMRQLGNAVPVELATIIARSISSVLESKHKHRKAG